jgi:hypothetical protein
MICAGTQDALTSGMSISPNFDLFSSGTSRLFGRSLFEGGRDGGAQLMPVLPSTEGTAVPMPTVTPGHGTAVPMPVLEGPPAFDALPATKPEALPGAKPEPLPARPNPAQAEGARRRAQNQDDVMRRHFEGRLACLPGAQRPRVEAHDAAPQGETPAQAAPAQEAPRPRGERVVREARPRAEVAPGAANPPPTSGARANRGQGVGEPAPQREAGAISEGDRGPRVAEHQRQVGQDLQRLGLSEDAVRGLLDPGGANRGGPYDGVYGPNTASATRLRDELVRRQGRGELTPDMLRSFEVEFAGRGAAPATQPRAEQGAGDTVTPRPAAPRRGPGDTVTPRAQPRAELDTVTPRSKPRAELDTVTPRSKPRAELDTVTPRSKPRAELDTVTPGEQPAPACRLPGA